ncbi:Serine/threonine-protein phosphatase 6 regulatory subunit 2-like protein [Drosera capensis]
MGATIALKRKRHQANPTAYNLHDKTKQNSLNTNQIFTSSPQSLSSSAAAAADSTPESSPSTFGHPPASNAVSIGLSTASPVETILDKEDFTLEELLQEDEIIQECKALNSRLINL